MLDSYCISCHNQRLKTAGLALDTIDAATPQANPEVWERVITRLRAGSMPPAGRPRPDSATYEAVASALESEIDRAWIANPKPGRVNAVHRLNRTQYTNAVRDLFALDPKAFDVKSLLPGDETADGSFDNFADVLTISTAHLERYLSAARQVTRLATGLPPTSPALDTFEIPLHVVQDDRQGEDLPFGSRGGVAVRYEFPVDGEYLIKVRLRRQYQDYLMGMGWPQLLDVRLDGKLLKRFTVGGNAPGTPAAASYAGDGEPGFAGAPEWETFMQLTGDAGLEVRVPVSAGPRVVGVSFVRELWEPEGLPQPLQRGRVLTNDQIYMGNAAVGSVQIGGPYRAEGTATNTPSRRAIFTCEPDEQAVPAASQAHRTRRARRTVRRESCRGRRGWRIDGRSRRRIWTPCSTSTRRAGARAEASRRASSSRSSGCSSIRISCCVFNAIRLCHPAHRRPRRVASPTSSSRLGCRSFCGAACPTSRCWTLPSAASCRGRRLWTSRCGACWPIRVQPRTW